jgi:hypothetical protein
MLILQMLAYQSGLTVGLHIGRTVCSGLFHILYHIALAVSALA